ncbi:MAG: hypothetical protein LQ344_003775 [Seirophora lacunosa]|nr:MAG: hypothetical protein LQ344_003775 [Seirophora lacunosa]
MNESQGAEEGTRTVQDTDSDWEYEYDDTETEAKSNQSFYITIDISSHSHQTRAPTKPAAPSKAASPVPTQHGQRQEEEGNTSADPAETPAVDPALQTAASVSDKSTTAPTMDPPRNRIQILDLHTQNPLLSYQNRIYTCAWSSTLGTDIFLTRPTSDLPPSITPLLSLPSVSVIGTSCINLTARPATVVPKADNPPPPPSSPPLPPNNPSHPASTPAPIQKIPLADSAPTSRRTQATFLESLMALKAAKGERDRVTVHAIKSHQGVGWRVRKRVLDMLELEGQGDGDGEDSSRAAAAAGHDGGSIGEGRGGDGAASPAKRARKGAAGGDGGRGGSGGGGGSGRRIGRPRGSRARQAEGALFSAAADTTPARWEDVYTHAGSRRAAESNSSSSKAAEIGREEIYGGQPPPSPPPPPGGGVEGGTEMG